jgi:Family of unknown function (DUF695)
MTQNTVLAGAAAPVWETRNVSRRGLFCRYRVNTALRHASDTSLYPYRLEVVGVLAETGWGGLPTAAENRRLDGIEEKVTAVVAGRAVLAGLQTFRGVRWLVFYTDSPDWTAELSGPLREATGDDLRVTCEPDPGWDTYRNLRGKASRKIAGYVVLCALPFLFGVVVWVKYGPAWGLGELTVLAVLVAALLLSRKPPQGPPAHPALLFGALAVGLSALLFPILAIVHLPVLAGLAISLLAGTVLTARVWKAQLQYWRDLPEPK